VLAADPFDWRAAASVQTAIAPERCGGCDLGSDPP
jgi:hypothetical protein